MQSRSLQAKVIIDVDIETQDELMHVQLHFELEIFQYAATRLIQKAIGGD